MASLTPVLPGSPDPRHCKSLHSGILLLPSHAKGHIHFLPQNQCAELPRALEGWLQIEWAPSRAMPGHLPCATPGLSCGASAESRSQAPLRCAQVAGVEAVPGTQGGQQLGLLLFLLA